MERGHPPWGTHIASSSERWGRGCGVTACSGECHRKGLYVAGSGRAAKNCVTVHGDWFPNRMEGNQGGLTDFGLVQISIKSNEWYLMLFTKVFVS